MITKLAKKYLKYKSPCKNCLVTATCRIKERFYFSKHTCDKFDKHVNYAVNLISKCDTIEEIIICGVFTIIFLFCFSAFGLGLYKWFKIFMKILS